MRLFYLIVFMLSLGGLHAQTDQKTGYGIQFDQRHIELGEVIQGNHRNFEYSFINSGTEDITIELVSACECTEVDYPVLPIKPGDRGTLKIDFDSTQKDSSETVDIDLILSNIDPKTDNPIFEILTYSFELVKP